MHNIIIDHQDTLGSLWGIGWLFTIGYLRLKFWKSVWAIIVWPYYIGKHFHKAS